MNNAIRYRVQVIALVERVEVRGKEWTVVAHEPIEGTDKLRPVHGYTPEIEKIAQKEMSVFDQTVDTLDMAALVFVVNGLQKP